MKELILKYNEKITIFYFYSTILSQIEELKKHDFEGCIVLDFSDVKEIESSVIPNLLILGNYIENKTKYKPVIYIDESKTSGALKRYLYGIGFFNLCEQSERFYFDCNKYTGWPEAKKMDKLNTTVYFNKATLEELDISQEPEYPLLSKRIWDDIYSNLYVFSSRYLGAYQEFAEYNDITSEMESNMALSMSHELIKNSLVHGKSYSYVTYQINRARKKIYLTLSDFGMGFYNSLTKRGIKVQNEGMAIIKGISMRADESGYGLYDVVCRTLKQNGIVRIHSNTTKIVLTNDSENQNDGHDTYLSYLEKRDFDGLANKLKSHNRYNYIDNLFFPGVHVEIVLPIEMSMGNV